MRKHTEQALLPRNCGSKPKEHSERLYRALNERIWELEAQGMSSYQLVVLPRNMKHPSILEKGRGKKEGEWEKEGSLKQPRH